MSVQASGPVPTLAELQSRRAELVRIASAHGASDVRVFGSVARGEPDAHDVDLLVALEPGRSLLDLGALTMDMADALGCAVDVVTDGGLKRRMRDSVAAAAVAL